MIVQFPDLTEIKYCTSFGIIRTEFAFYLQALWSGQDATRLAEQNGFKPISCMNNWWPSHCGENRTMTLWWKKIPENNQPQLTGRTKWGENQSFFKNKTKRYQDIIQHLAASGCAFKIGEPPFKVELFHRFFTLMRLPLELTKVEEKKLVKSNYRFLDKGTLAQYWINGWPPNEHSFDKEYKYFGTTQEEWRLHGMDGYD